MRVRSEAPTAPENGVNAVTNGISDMRRLLSQRPDTPQVRALRGRLQSYETIVGEWVRVPPTEPQRAAMVECLRELKSRVEAVEDGPDIPLRRTTRPPAPGSLVPPSQGARGASERASIVPPSKKPTT